MRLLIMVPGIRNAVCVWQFADVLVASQRVSEVLERSKEVRKL